ncbi:MAG TPA: hypothetical protein VEW25_08250 [Allosphingosinicella sp.]|nr:hypothetical protein [Allosphingosinicella sp.]
MRAIALLALLAGCGGEPENRAANQAENGVRAQSMSPPAADLELSRAAAAALGLYYEHLGRRAWRAAFAMRQPEPGLTIERFVANYQRYEDYRATVGVPSLPARRDGDIWVQVPVQLYGRMRGGRPFGSVGAVTLKRAAGDNRWLILS